MNLSERQTSKGLWRLVNPVVRIFLITGLLWTSEGCASLTTQEPSQSPEPQQTQKAQSQTPKESGNTLSKWITKCDAPKKKTAAHCTIQQTIIVTKTRQRLLSFTVKVPSDAPLPAMMIQLPMGLFLPDGIKVSIDEKNPLSLKVQTCNPEGCFAGSAISRDMLDSMIKGKRLNITFSNLAKKKINVPVDLEGFGKSYQKIR